MSRISWKREIPRLVREFGGSPTWLDHFDRLLLEVAGRDVLELGPGRVRRPGVVTMDVNPALSPEFLHDANVVPWPLPSDSLDAVIMMSVLEHVDKPITVMKEVHRVLRSNGLVAIVVPHFSSGATFVDPTHRHHFSARSLDYVIMDTPQCDQYGFYEDFRFLSRRRLVWLQGWMDSLPFARALANRGTMFWEDYLCYVLRGGGVYFELVKP